MPVSLQYLKDAVGIGPYTSGAYMSTVEAVTAQHPGGVGQKAYVARLTPGLGGGFNREFMPSARFETGAGPGRIFRVGEPGVYEVGHFSNNPLAEEPTRYVLVDQNGVAMLPSRKFAELLTAAHHPELAHGALQKELFTSEDPLVRTIYADTRSGWRTPSSPQRSTSGEVFSTPVVEPVSAPQPVFAEVR